MDQLGSLLDMLQDFDIKTSFALVGSLVRAYPEETRQILLRGHEIVNHTSTHPQRFSMIGRDAMRKEVDDFQNLIADKFSYIPCGFRAPHLMRKLDESLFRALLDNRLYDTSYVGTGVSAVYGVVELPLTPCPEHRQLSFDYWHNFQLPFIRTTGGKYLRLWRKLLAQERFVNVFLDATAAARVHLREMIEMVPDGLRFRRLGDIATTAVTRGNN
jgi:hypothetical protein